MAGHELSAHRSNSTLPVSECVGGSPGEEILRQPSQGGIDTPQSHSHGSAALQFISCRTLACFRKIGTGSYELREGYKKAGARFLGIAGFIIACVALWSTMSAMNDGRKSQILAEWTAKKDFIEFCQMANYESPGCEPARNMTLDPPPSFSKRGWGDSSTRITSNVHLLNHATLLVVVICCFVVGCRRRIMAYASRTGPIWREPVGAPLLLDDDVPANKLESTPQETLSTGVSSGIEINSLRYPHVRRQSLMEKLESRVYVRNSPIGPPPVRRSSITHLNNNNEANRSVSPVVLERKRIYMCECCPKKPRKFDSKEKLKNHEAIKQRECLFCPLRFSSGLEIRRHQSIHLRRRGWCYSAFKSHDETEAPDGSIHTDTCGFCGERFPRSGRDADGATFVTESNWTDRIAHLEDVHNLRECKPFQEALP